MKPGKAITVLLVLVGLTLVLAVSCDALFGTATKYLQAQRGSSVNYPGHGMLAPGDRVVVTYVPGESASKQVTDNDEINFILENAGALTIDYWGISLVVEPYDSQDEFSVVYEHSGSGFSLAPGEKYTFAIATDVIVQDGTDRTLTVNITNKNDITPNPYTFTVLITLP